MRQDVNYLCGQFGFSGECYGVETPACHMSQSYTNTCTQEHMYYQRHKHHMYDMQPQDRVRTSVTCTWFDYIVCVGQQPTQATINFFGQAKAQYQLSLSTAVLSIM